MPPRTRKKTTVKINKPPVLFGKTQRLLTRIEKVVGAPVIAYWNSPGGEVCHGDAVVLYEILSRIGEQKRASLFIKSDGGSGLAALRMVHLLRQFITRFSALVPLECASAATMLALGADEIRMGPTAYLSAVDTSITHELSPIDRDNDLVSVSQDELNRVVKLWLQKSGRPNENPYQYLFQHVHPLVIGAVDRSSSLSIKLCKEILSYHMRDKRRADRIARRLNSEYPSHSYPITFQEAGRLGLKVRPLETALNDLLIELSELYSEMGQKAITDFDEQNYHNNEIVNIMETRGFQVFYQIDKDWHYRQEERRWTSLHDASSWRKLEKQGRRTVKTVFHIR